MSLDSIPPVALPPTSNPGQGSSSTPITLASFEQHAASEARGRELAPGPGTVDALFVVLIAVLAFLLASLPARNSDLWLHLAAGRSVIQGQAVRGVDPFASTTTGVFWVNHSWLADVVLYELYELGDGRALVLAKCVLVTVLAGLFFCFRRPGTRLGVVSLAAAGAVLALGPWLVLQPTLLSLLGVVLTLYLLEWPSLLDGSRAERARLLRWLLVPLFALWANLDAWFLLGPVLVGLYALGELLHRVLGGARAVRPGELRTLLLLAPAGLAACLLTPYHYHTLAWPTPLGLSHAEQVLMRDPVGQGLVVSPFAKGGTGEFLTAHAFASPGGWAYCLLLVAGAASFALGGRALHPGRLLVWLALAGLSIYQARAIPFFAVAAAPILALNIQEYVRSAVLSEPLRRLQIAARGAGVLAGLALLVLAWPGWLQPTPYRPRAWEVEPDASLVRLARRLDGWHADHRFQDDRFALTSSPEVAHYLAWFCPAEKGFLDSRWPLFDQMAEDYVRMRRCLLETEGAGADRELGHLLDVHQVDRIILFDPDWERTTRAYRRLLLDGDEWQELDVEGTAVLFGRRSRTELPSWKALDRRHAAYHPEPDRVAPLAAPRAPQLPASFAAFSGAPDDRSPDRAEAALHLIYFDLKSERMQEELATQWLLAQATGLVGSGPGSAPGGTPFTLAIRLHLAPLLPVGNLYSSTFTKDSRPQLAKGLQAAEAFRAGFMASHDRGPPEAVLLALRACRRALAANPDDAGAFLLLGEAYLRQGSQTREGSWLPVLPALTAIRRAQLLTALEQAVLLRPDLDQAHDLLAQFYYEAGQMDRALDHLRARLRIADEEAKKRGPNAAAAAERRVALLSAVETMDALVRQSLKIYETNTEGKTDPSQVLERARVAYRHGLTRKALEMLLESHPAIFGKAGVELQLKLMLQAGRAFEVRAWLEPEHEAGLGFSSYHTLQAQAAAACGDYAAADAELEKLGEQVRQVQTSADNVLPVRSAVALRVGGAVLARPVYGAGPAGLAGMGYQQYDELRPLGRPAALLGQEADVEVLRGLLATESGEVKAARQHFRAALDVWGSDDRAGAGAGIDFLTRPLAQQALRLLEDK